MKVSGKEINGFEITEGIIAQVNEFRGEHRVDIRKVYSKDGSLNFTSKGVNMLIEQFDDFCSNLDDLKELVEGVR